MMKRFPLAAFAILLLASFTWESSVPLFSPMQLARPNKDHTGYEVVPETLSRLIQPGGNPDSKRIAVVSVVGPYHSGKSFLLNALIGQTSVFSVGPKTSPETMGLWLCRTNMTLPAFPDVEVWFVDSEGFFGPQISEAYDAKTFTLSLMLADEFVYNTVKIIDSQAVSLLEMLARRAQLFKVKSAVVEESSVHARLHRLPHLTWVVEDFVQSQDEGQTNTNWLESYLVAQGADQPYLTKVFPHLAVKSLFLPATSRQALSDLSKVPFHQLTPEFRADLQSLRASIVNRLDTGKKLTEFVTVSDFVQSVYFLAKALEKGLFPQMPSLWASWRAQVVETSMKDAFGLFDSTLAEKIDSVGPTDAMPGATEFNRITSEARNMSLVLYAELVRDFLADQSGGADGEPVLELSQLVPQLDEQLRARHTVSHTQYMDAVKQFLGEKLRVEFTSFLAKIPAVFDGKDLIEPGHLQAELGRLAIERVNEYARVVARFATNPDPVGLPDTWPAATFPAFKIHPVDELRGELQSQIDSILLENDKGIANLIKAGIVAAVSAADDMLGNASSTLFSSGELAGLNQRVLATATARFEQSVGVGGPRAWMREISPQYENAGKKIAEEIGSRFHKFKSSNEDRLYEWFRKNSDKALNVYRDMKRTVETSMLPCDEAVMEREHGRAVEGLVHALDVDLGAARFNDSAPYRETRGRLDAVVDGEYAKLRKKNIELWKVHSDEATHCAFELNAQYVDLHCPQGWFCWFKVWPGSHRAGSAAHLFECFARSGKPPSASIQTQIFESWYEKELAREAAEVKNNMWIALVSLLVPIAWIVYVRM